MRPLNLFRFYNLNIVNVLSNLPKLVKTPTINLWKKISDKLIEMGHVRFDEVVNWFNR